MEMERFIRHLLSNLKIIRCKISLIFPLVPQSSRRNESNSYFIRDTGNQATILRSPEEEPRLEDRIPVISSYVKPVRSEDNGPSANATNEKRNSALFFTVPQRYRYTSEAERAHRLDGRINPTNRRVSELESSCASERPMSKRICTPSIWFFAGINSRSPV